MKRNENGFSAVEGLLIVIIIGIIGFVGWYVWHSKQTTDKSATNSSSSTPAATNTSKTTSAQTPQAFVAQFLKDYKAADKTKVNAAVTAALSTKYGGDDFYGKCSGDEGCNSILKDVDLGTTTPVVTDYTAKNGDKGKQLVYSVTTTVNGAKSVNEYTYRLISKGTSWQLDDFDWQFKDSASL